ncbi:hypothetical protein Nepgr_010810 [Nepenthes gracilis]|uniref:Uncharacterized protein n=1 Tax=Nepenthes gracilis TaxID=150966 RepID=A0AAD3XLP4_NEPGR|nr:hypothetical protein Nepgr_010810 [Nepenthes gracilis]
MYYQCDLRDFVLSPELFGTKFNVILVDPPWRIELFGEDHNIQSGWLTIGKGLSSSNFNAEAYIRNFVDKDGKLWQGGGQNPPPEALHLVQTTPEIEAIRPKSPMKNQQQLLQQSTTISLTTANSSNKKPAVNSPQNPTSFSLNQEATSDILDAWASPRHSLKGQVFCPSNNVFDIYGYDAPSMQPNGEYLVLNLKQ